MAMPPSESLVSVIVRSMARPTLAASLASIGAQEYRPIEVVVVAAAGTDHPPLPSVARDCELRLIVSSAPLRRAAAANAGIVAARGTWIVFLDDDDVFLPDHVGGLMAARHASRDAGVMHCYARSILSDGSPPRVVGQPHATMELFDRNYITLPTALFSRALAARGCRFDESLDILEDWDFLLQLAQLTRFHFVPQHTFVWNADRGTSGAGGGENYKPAVFSSFRRQINEKWSSVRAALAAEVKQLLEPAEHYLAQGDWAKAEQCCQAALSRSQNDPKVLNCLAMVRQTAGDLAGACAALELANSVRPHDVRLLHNLALVRAARGEFALARACVDRAIELQPQFEPARRLSQRLAAHFARR